MASARRRDLGLLPLPQWGPRDAERRGVPLAGEGNAPSTWRKARRVRGGSTLPNPTPARALSWARINGGPRPMLKAPLLLAAVVVVCVASSADARRRHHSYYGYGERSPSSFDDWRRGRDTQNQGQDRGQGKRAGPGPRSSQDQRQDQNQGQSQNRGQDSVRDRRSDRVRERGDRRRVRSLDEWRRSRDTQNLGQDLARDRGEDRSHETYDRRRSRYDERRARYEDWRRGRDREREDWTRRREAERGDAALRPARGGPFAAVVEKLVRGCGQQGAEFENWPFDAIAQIVGADEKERTALAALRERAKKAAEQLAADCPQDVPAAPAARLEAVEQGIDAALAAFYGTLDDEQKARLYRDYSSRRDRARAYAAAREAAAREPTPSQARSQAAASGWSGAMCEELAAVLRGWPVREI